MLTGREKAKILLDILGHRASKVLSHLQPQYAQILTSSIEDAPEVSQGDLIHIVGEVLENRDRFQTYNANQIGMNIEQAPQGAYEPQQDVYQGISTISDTTEGVSLTSPGGDFQYDDEEAPVDPRIQKMARVLAKQRPNMIAFFLHYLGDPDKTLIWNELPLRLQKAVRGIEIESVPASKIMFDKLHDMIMNDPDFENSEIPEPKGLEPGDENLYDGQLDDHEDSLQGAVDMLSGALDSGLAYSYNDMDDDDEDDDDEDHETAISARSQGSALPESPVEKKSSLSSDVQLSEPVQLNSLSLSDGIETVNFPDLSSLDANEPVAHESAYEAAPTSYSDDVYEAPQDSASGETSSYQEERDLHTNDKPVKKLSSSVSFDEDLLGPNF